MRLSIPSSASTNHYRVVIMGGGAGGCALSHRLSRFIPKGQFAVIEPKENHFFQPGFTLVGSGFRKLEACVKPNSDCLHKDAVWYRNSVAQLNPTNNCLILNDGTELKYEFLIVAAGLEIRFDMIEGLSEAFEVSPACSVYRPMLAQKTNREFHAFKGGNAIFTFPNTPIKCAGAPQKLCYVGDDLFRQNGVRDKAQVMYNTALGQVFGVDHYAKALMKVIKKKDIQLNVRHNLVKVDPLTRTATFELLDEQAKPKGDKVDFHYDFLHVGAPCSPVKALRQCKELTDADGWLDVDPDTLISTKFDNVFGVGDCMNTPNAKTVAAVSSHLRALSTNIKAVINGKSKRAKYDGYGSCPLLVSTRRVILAEFSKDGPLETLPISQNRPLYAGYLMKRYFLPFLYWRFLIKGLWLGPATFRKMFHPIETVRSLMKN